MQLEEIKAKPVKEEPEVDVVALAKAAVEEPKGEDKKEPKMI